VNEKTARAALAVVELNADANGADLGWRLAASSRILQICGCTISEAGELLGVRTVEVARALAQTKKNAEAHYVADWLFLNKVEVTP
jgi:hypothetical protein